MKTLQEYYIYFVKEFPLRLQNVIAFSQGMSEDLLDVLLRKNHSLTPPMSIRLKAGDYWSPRYYRGKGYSRFRFFLKFCRPKKNAHILEIGCGCGQMASQLLSFLSSDALYQGMDVNREEINWCMNNIKPLRENFNFSVVDVFNKIYNPGGRVRAHRFRFPYKNSTFDFVILLSVFTHMVPKDVENYVREIFRVLKKGGKCFLTFFLLNKYSLSSLSHKRTAIVFPTKYSDFRLLDPTNPECAIAYNEDFIGEVLKRSGFKKRPFIHYGSWSSRKKTWDYQDLLIGTK
ncbi:class I SAM-dependent methyltransferase [Candidatus Gottesmanbacteria bacterium]|nr:class I SAM-dependent methyltransferase [Candidatus Gottesmanbacteria bacterium]